MYKQEESKRGVYHLESECPDSLDVCAVFFRLTSPHLLHKCMCMTSSNTHHIKHLICKYQVTLNFKTLFFILYKIKLSVFSLPKGFLYIRHALASPGALTEHMICPFLDKYVKNNEMENEAWSLSDLLKKQTNSSHSYDCRTISLASC